MTLYGRDGSGAAVVTRPPHHREAPAAAPQLHWHVVLNGQLSRPTTRDVADHVARTLWATDPDARVFVEPCSEEHGL